MTPVEQLAQRIVHLFSALGGVNIPAGYPLLTEMLMEARRAQWREAARIANSPLIIGNALGRDTQINIVRALEAKADEP